MGDIEIIGWETSQFTIRTMLKIGHDSFYPIKVIEIFAVLRDL